MVFNLFGQNRKKILLPQRVVSFLKKLILTNSLSLFISGNLFYFSGIIPSVSSRKLFQLGDNGAWVTYHEKLKKYFSISL
jgi:hypothetical protein